MFKTKTTTPYWQVNFCIWILEKFCGRTLKRNSIKITTQPYEKEEMVFTDTYGFDFYGRKIIINVIVATAISVLLLTWLIYRFTKSNVYSFFTSPFIFVLLFAVFDKFFPDSMLSIINFLLKKKWEKFRAVCKKASDEQKNN